MSDSSVTPWTVTPQARLSTEFSRQGYRGGLPFPSPGNLSDPGIQLTYPVSPALAGRFLPTDPPGKPQSYLVPPLKYVQNWITCAHLHPLPGLWQLLPTALVVTLLVPLVYINHTRQNETLKRQIRSCYSSLEHCNGNVNVILLKAKARFCQMSCRSRTSAPPLHLYPLLLLSYAFAFSRTFAHVVAFPWKTLS